MAESSYASEMVKAGAALVVPCPNDQTSSLVMEWRTLDSDTVIGHWLTCARCRPKGVWSCAFCPALIDPDAVKIRAHVAACYG